MTLEQIRELLKGASLSKVSRETGIPRRTLYNIRDKKFDFPTMRNMEKLQNYFKEQGNA